MVAPVIISVTMEVLAAVPKQARESSLALGTTRWETVGMSCSKARFTA